MLGDGRVVHARREQQRYAQLRAGRHVDLVHAHAVFADHPEPWPRLLEHGPGDRIVPAEVAVDVAEVLRNKFVRNARVRDIRISTETLAREDGTPSNVSSIEIALVRTEDRAAPEKMK